MNARPGELTAPQAARALGVSPATLLTLDGVLHPRVESAGAVVHRYYGADLVAEYRARRARALAELRGGRG